MKLIIDIGNTSGKFALFQENKLIELHYFSTIDTEIIEKKFLEKSKKIDSVILASVIHHGPELEKWLNTFRHFIKLDHSTPIPIGNNYASPETLGMDRLACAVGVHSLSKGQNVLAIEAGTCIKFEFVDENGIYHGGAISPGIRLRYTALNTFTDKLPLVTNMDSEILIGNDTFSSIGSGVINGAIAEVDGIIDRYKQRYPNLNVFLSGGDANIFAKSLKNSIFAVENLVLLGLNEILNFNDL